MKRRRTSCPRRSTSAGRRSRSSPPAASSRISARRCSTSARRSRSRSSLGALLAFTAHYARVVGAGDPSAPLAVPQRVFRHRLDAARGDLVRRVDGDRRVHDHHRAAAVRARQPARRPRRARSPSSLDMGRSFGRSAMAQLSRDRAAGAAAVRRRDAADHVRRRVESRADRRALRRRQRPGLHDQHRAPGLRHGDDLHRDPVHHPRGGSRRSARCSRRSSDTRRGTSGRRRDERVPIPADSAGRPVAALWLANATDARGASCCLVPSRRASLPEFVLPGPARRRAAALRALHRSGLPRPHAGVDVRVLVVGAARARHRQRPRARSSARCPRSTGC